ncbi:MAG TPA: BON domain-containing protein [Trinickia sp.]|uniref:BON domain-containing protein n=1 Tax=Trinickia sp. TaxID=2571163 RepID=UPI002C9BCD69|nr:BON domain-containing protein [Trinickia sp.]HTI16861.1 BON domain-containing protein [Trinickia sp.]
MKASTALTLRIAAALGFVVLAVSAAAQSGSQSGQAGANSSGSASDSVGQNVSDSTITTKTKAQLMGAKDLDSGKIHVTTHHGVVSLTGTVPSTAEKQHAQEIVNGVSGVRSVKNHLKIVEQGASQ